MYYYVTMLYPFLTSLETLHGFISNFVLMFLRWTPTKFVKIGLLPHFSWNKGNFVQFLANS